MARGQMTVLRALVRRSILSRHLFSVKPICVENSYFSGAGFSEPDCLGLSMGEIHRRYIHSFSPSSLYFEPALHHFENKHLKTLGNAKYFSVLFEQGEQISDSTEKTGAATRTESATEMSEDANSSEISEDAEASKEGEVNSRSTGDIRFSDPAALFQEMSQFTQVSKLAKSEIEQLMEILRWFAKTGWARDQALALYISASFFPTAVSKFGKFFVNKCPRDVFDYLMKLGPCKQSDQFLFPIFMEFCLKEFPDEIKRFRTMVQSADLTKPHRWFPFARAMKRKIIYHCGPTNSGKTYNALQRYMEAKSGIYCSPLRLLAMEVFDKVNALGVYCSLHTGQEKKRVPFANHVACTIEMASTDECYEVAVIDEIQMIGDEVRGFAWSRALLGLKADEIHVCGDPSCLSLVRNICADTGDELIEHHYGRFKPLVVEAKTILGNFQNIQSGDCIVAFSRREIFEIKLAVERFTKHRCCVIYGALPPETRKQQANLFNSQDNEYDVLVASDAVGMGLNLNIRRVVFYSLIKHNGDKRIPVPASQVKQIAGRAGRRGSVYPEGLTTTFQLEDLDYLIECMKTTFVECKSAGLFPFFEQVELFAGQLPDITFSQLLEKFADSCVLDGAFFLCRHDHIKRVAHMLDRVPGLSLEDRYNFCFSPVNTRDPQAMSSLLRFAFQYSKNLPVRIAMGVPKDSAKNDEDLLNLETKHQVLSMYMWLSQHFSEGTFPYKETAERMASDIADLLGQSLAKARWKPESRGRIVKKAPPEKGGSVARQLQIMKAMVDGDKPAMGYIYEAMDLAKEAIKRRYGDDETKYMPLWDIIDARWDRQLHSPLHVARYFLNPQYFYDKSKFNDDGEVGRGLMTCVERCFPDPEQQSRVVSQLQNYRTPSKLFAYTSAIRQRSKMLPGLWWQNFGSDTPDLKRFAIRILNQACSASGCERNWSMFEKIHSKKRNRLTQKRLNDLVFVHYHLRLRNKQILGETRELEFEGFII